MVTKHTPITEERASHPDRDGVLRFIAAQHNVSVWPEFDHSGHVLMYEWLQECRPDLWFKYLTWKAMRDADV